MHIPLERLLIMPMASGNTSLLLTERVEWGLFPEYADAILQILDGVAIDRVDGPDQRLWTVRIGSEMFWLTYEDYPVGVSLDPQDQAASALIPGIREKLMQRRAASGP